MDHFEPTLDELAAAIGGHNWVVVARRTPRIVARYGEDVICISQRKYLEIRRRIMLARTEGYD